MNADGSGKVLLAKALPQRITAYSWSPDGKWIAFPYFDFVGEDTLRSVIMLVKSDGTEHFELAVCENCNIWSISWAP